MAYGLPVEGKDGPFLGGQLSEVVTCDVGSTVGDARRMLDETGDESIVVLAGGSLVVGEVEAETLHGHGDDERLLDVMDPVPTTVRPSVTVESLAESGGGRRLVTTSDGRLLGQAIVEADDDHDHHEHDHDHDHGDEVDTDAFDRELADVMEAIEERFGDREPSEAELRAFLRERMLAAGKSAEEADRCLDELEPAEEG